MSKILNKDKRILITGGSGFIGTNMVGFLRKKKINYLNLDINPPKNKIEYENWCNLDIENYELLEKELFYFNPTHIIHLAASLGMDHKSLDSLSTNIKGVENIVKISKKLKLLEKVVFTSSLLVCKNGYIPRHEKDYCPPNFYGRSKMLGEKIVFNGDLDKNWSIVRPTSIWGPYFDYSYKMFFESIDKNRYMHIGRKEIEKPACFVGNAVYMIYKMSPK